MPLEDTGLGQVVYEFLTEYQALETKFPLGFGILNILNREYCLASFLPPSSPTLGVIKPLEIRRSRLQGCNLRLADILWERRDASDRPHYTATDPRDIVFGLLGMLEDEEAQKVRADYTQLFDEVFIRATRVMLDSPAGDAPNSVNLSLDFINPGTPSSALPTGVPDWRLIGNHGVDISPINSSGRFNASGSLGHQHQWSLGLSMEGRCLRQRGCMVDEVTEIMRKSHRVHQGQFLSLTLSDEASWFQAVKTFVRLGVESTQGEEYVWRTLTNDSYHASAHGSFCGQECVMID
ncbi:hypothetical protein LZ30DRAFT_689314 [Colletotrichum cereale]|nr:hypothetical protein LZ30DRAFT_689314 [Colletotrichum cereale]